MILEELIITDFRLYYGTHKIRFATSDSANVTVIHGENGSGKTTFLNALTWCLYGEVDLPNPERLLNERRAEELQPGGVAEVSVALRFREGRRAYVARRTQEFLKIDNRIDILGETDFQLGCMDENGEWHEYREPQAVIEQILPYRMRTYFFFDGERIDNLAKDDNREEIVRAIRNVMGLELVERSLGHLRKARNDLQGELKKIGDVETQSLIGRLEQLQQQVESEQRRQEQYERNREALEREKREIEQRLRNLEEAKQYQARRDELEKRRARVDEERSAVWRELKELVTREGLLVLLHPVAARASDILKESRARGEIPSGIKDQFVRDLLERGVCICGRELVQGSEAYERVEAWVSRAGNSVLDDRVIEASVVGGTILAAPGRFFERLELLRKRYDTLITEKDEIDEELDEISEKLAGKDVEEIRSLEVRLRRVEDEIRRAAFDAGECHARLKALERQIRELESRIRKLQLKEREADLAKRRLDACVSAISVVERIYEAAKEYTREEIEVRVNDIFRQLLRKPFYVDITDTYELHIKKGPSDAPVPAAMSQGERQVASLSFIGALVAIAKERASRGAKVFRGGVYPIVMDSPFGTLDVEYRRNVARGLPALAHQIVLLVSSSQWSREVEEEIRPRIGFEYRLRNSTSYPEYTVVEVISNGQAHSSSQG